MDATLLTQDSFWDEETPVALVPSGMKAPHLSAAPPLIYFQTSGSLGKPKWVGLSRLALEYSAMVVNAHLHVGAGSTWGLALPVEHVGGMGVLARAREAGCALEVFQSKWQEHDFVSWIEAREVSHTSLVPTQVHDIVASGLRAPRGLRAVVVGGGQLSEETGEIARCLGWPILASYGMTEAGSQIATQGFDCLELFYSNAPIEKLAHWELREEEDGCLAIKGKSLFDGVLVEEKGKWVFRERRGEWYVTRDRVKLSDAGITPLGRADLRVKVKGELVNLEDIEERLVFYSFRRIRFDQVVVVALPDDRAEHKLQPVFDASLGKDLIDEVMRAYSAQVFGVERLQDPVMIENFPRSGLGKPLREKIRMMLDTPEP